VNVFGSHVMLLYGLLLACSCSESLKIPVAVKGNPFRHLVAQGLGTIGSQRSRRSLGSMWDQRLPLVLVRRLWIRCLSLPVTNCITVCSADPNPGIEARG
jgi:hypothetical protein